MSGFGNKGKRTVGAVVGPWWSSIACCVLLVACGGTSTAVDDPDNGKSSDGTGDGANKSAPDDDDDDGSGVTPDGEVGGTASGDDDDGGGGDDDDDGAGVTTPPPAFVVKTTQTREKMSELLVDPAAKALKDSKFELAITIYQALTDARGYDSDAAVELAKAWTLQGQNYRAVEVYNRYIATVDDPTKLKAAKKERDRLASSEARFSGEYKFAPATDLATKVFGLGRAAYKKKDWGDAIVYYEMGFALDPDLAGFLREMGAAYDALEITDKKVESYQAYLQRRPFGKNADDVRKELQAHKGVLGTLEMTSPLDCQESWINGQMYGKLPAKKKVDLVMAPGAYKALCYAPKYGMAYFEYAKVEAGKTSKLEFNWAIVSNQLKKPFGRIAIEDARKPGLMYDLGIDKDEFGVLVPPDGRALTIILKSDDGSKNETRSKRIDPGTTEVIKW